MTRKTNNPPVLTMSTRSRRRRRRRSRSRSSISSSCSLLHPESGVPLQIPIKGLVSLPGESVETSGGGGGFWREFWVRGKPPSPRMKQRGLKNRAGRVRKPLIINRDREGSLLCLNRPFSSSKPHKPAYP
jgi:hypothetical protein